MDDFGTACGLFLLSAKLQFCDSLRADQRSALFLSLSAGNPAKFAANVNSKCEKN